MITAILAARDQEAELAIALAALVPAATEGLIREVIVVDSGSSDGTIAVADAAGCTILEGRGGEVLRRAADRARGDWLLFISPSAALEHGWQNEVMAFIDGAVLSGRALELAATFRLGLLEPGIGPRLAEWSSGVMTRLFAAPREGQGLLISRGFYRALGGHKPLTKKPDLDLARRVGAGRLALLRTRALVQPRRRRPDASNAFNPSSSAVSSASRARPGAA